MTGEILPPLESGGFVKPKDHLGHLVIFTAVHDSRTQYDDVRKQDVEILTVDWACFTCGGGPNTELQERAMLGSPWITNKIRRDGNLTLGYFNELPPKPGYKDGAQIITEPRPEDIPRASAWWDAVKASKIQGPAGGPPAPDAWGAPPPAQGAWGSSPATSPAAPAGGGWGASGPAQPVASPTPPAQAWTAPAPAQDENAPVFPNGPTLAQLRAMPRDSVAALVSQGMIPADAARAAGHQV